MRLAERRDRNDLIGIGMSGEKARLPHFVTTYSMQYQDIVKIVKQCLPILYADKALYDVHQRGCSFSSKKCPTLGSVLSPSLFRSQTRQSSHTWLNVTGSYPCGHGTCRQCCRHNKSKTVTSFSTGRVYSRKNYINCHSKHVIYVIKCKACQMQYVGCTIHSLRVRISEN